MTLYPHKKYIKGGFSRKKDAEAAARKIENAIDENRFIEPSNKLFSVYVKEWFYDHYQKRITIPTLINRENILNTHLLKNNLFFDKEISKITAVDIDIFYNQKINENYSTSYIRQMHQLLNQAFNQAVKWKKILSNPVIDADLPAVRYEEMLIWSIDEVNNFLKASKRERQYLAFILAVYTGMRRGEILGLKWSDIDFENKRIRVNRSLSYTTKRGYLFTALKTKKSKRQIPITEKVLNELRRHKSIQEEWKKLVGDLYQDQDLIICTNYGTEQNPQNLIRTMKRIIKAANVRSIRFHDIRHTHASILIAKGVDIVNISARLGHANPKITLEFYAHLLPDSTSEVAEVFHSALEKQRNDEEVAEDE